MFELALDYQYATIKDSLNGALFQVCPLDYKFITKEHEKTALKRVFYFIDAFLLFNNNALNLGKVPTFLAINKMSAIPFDKTDRKFMSMALGLARKGLGYTTPNPAVGAVIVKDGKVIGRGWHKRAGTAHAEVNAIRDAGSEAKGADIYVTLEPCNHTGRTPPCTRAVLEAGIKRVVIGAMDPNPKVKGGGAQFLRKKGLQVETGCLEGECMRLIAPFAKHMRTALPWVRLKAASSLDGRVASRTGHSKWITNEQARGFGQELRQWSDAILVGKNTALKDDPSLTFRKRGRPSKKLLRVILDSRLSLPLELKVFEVSGEAPTLVVTTLDAPKEKSRALEERGVQVVKLPASPEGQVDVRELMKFLGASGIQSVLVEGGAHVHGSFWDKGLVDEAFFFFAPIVIGGKEAPSSVLGQGVEKVSQAPRLHEVKCRWFGDNVLLSGLVSNLERFWS